jgi:hypothetical protein
MTTNNSDRRQLDDRTIQFVLEALVSGAIVCILLLVADAVYAIWYEAVVWPDLKDDTEWLRDYGIMWGVMRQLILMIGMALGFAFAAVRRWGRLTASLILAAASVVGAAIVGYVWLDQFHRYGLDPSDGIVFVPPLAMAAACMVLAAVLAVFEAIVALWRYGTLSPNGKSLPSVRSNSLKEVPVQ